MFNLQSEFIEFNDKIKISYDDNAELREKRDILLEKLKLHMSNEIPKFDTFVQGSYAMHTGITPNGSDYDIDVGLRFHLSRTDYPDPLTVKQWVFDALEGHTKKVEIRRSCVTVTYQENGSDAFHVDFACYATEGDELFIAKGRRNSSPELRVWEPSNPQELMKKMNDRFADKEDREQFRRIVRYMKKWKDTKFALGGNGAPTGIALTVLAYNMFEPSFKVNPLTGNKVYDDYAALNGFVSKLFYSFTTSYDSDEGKIYHLICQRLIVSPYNDLFEKMSLRQQEEFYTAVKGMKQKLSDVAIIEKKAEACRLLADIFGSDFPITTDRSYVGHSESA